MIFKGVGGFYLINSRHCPSSPNLGFSEFFSKGGGGAAGLYQFQNKKTSLFLRKTKLESVLAGLDKSPTFSKNLINSEFQIWCWKRRRSSFTKSSRKFPHSASIRSPSLYVCGLSYYIFNIFFVSFEQRRCLFLFSALFSELSKVICGEICQEGRPWVMAKVFCFATTVSLMSDDLSEFRSGFYIFQIL